MQESIKEEESALNRSTQSLRTPKDSIRSLIGSIRRKIITSKTEGATTAAGHVCEPIREGMSMCACGRRW